MADDDEEREKKSDSAVMPYTANALTSRKADLMGEEKREKRRKLLSAGNDSVLVR